LSYQPHLITNVKNALYCAVLYVAVTVLSAPFDHKCQECTVLCRTVCSSYCLISLYLQLLTIKMMKRLLLSNLSPFLSTDFFIAVYVIWRKKCLKNLTQAACLVQVIWSVIRLRYRLLITSKMQQFVMTYHVNVLSHSLKFNGGSFSLSMYITQQSYG